MSLDFKWLRYFILLSVSLNTNEIWQNNCITQTSPWSPCSKTCGRGVSLRLSNDNDQCMMEQESRLCNLRPCDVDITKHFRVNTNFVCFVIPQFVVFNYSFLISITSLVVHFPLLFKITDEVLIYNRSCTAITNWLIDVTKYNIKKHSHTSSIIISVIQPGKKCLNIYREREFQNFTISGCISKKPYWPKYCGVCSDERCCIPYKSKTIEVEFKCPNGAVLTWKYMWINACFCNLSCRNPNDIFADLEPYYEHNEIINWDWEKRWPQIFHFILQCAPLESVLPDRILDYKAI